MQNNGNNGSNGNNGNGNGSVRVLGEVLKGETLDGALNCVIKRHTLKGESKCAMIKRLLCTEGMTREKLIELVEKEHGELKDSTLNTIRADLKRQRGTGALACTGWRTDGKAGKLATAAVAKLRGAQLGDGYASAELITSAAATAATAASEESGQESAETSAESAGSEESAESTASAENSAETSKASKQASKGKTGKGKRKK